MFAMATQVIFQRFPRVERVKRIELVRSLTSVHGVMKSAVKKRLAGRVGEYTLPNMKDL